VPAENAKSESLPPVIGGQRYRDLDPQPAAGQPAKVDRYRDYRASSGQVN
jgi:hypothetical protein